MSGLLHCEVGASWKLYDAIGLHHNILQWWQSGMIYGSIFTIIQLSQNI